MARGNPEPWFRASRNTWYITLDGRQHNLHTSDKDEAYRLWHALMLQRDCPIASEEATVVEILALFADYTEKH